MGVRLITCLAALAVMGCGNIPPTRSWHPEAAVMQYAGPFQPPQPPPMADQRILRRIKPGDSENTIRAAVGTYPAQWRSGSAVRTEAGGVIYEVAYLYREQTGFIQDISYKPVAP